jgi:serine O-acetyltransferase
MPQKNAISRVIEDIDAALVRDPATNTRFEMFMTSPGLHAVWQYRVFNWLWKRGLRTLARVMSNCTRLWTGIEIHPGAAIGRRLFIDHGMGVVVGETAVIGDDVHMYHGVTFGGKTLESVKRHPTVGNHVTLGAGSTLIGDILIGDGASIGANTTVTHDVAPGSVVVGQAPRTL